MSGAGERGRNVVLGVTGSIAAHRGLDIAGALTRAGCRVQVVLTADAQRFVTPLGFRTLSRNPVITGLYDEEDGWKPMHVRAADEADLLVLAPATAATLARLAQGLADDALGCIALALEPGTPVLVAPAMNGKMWGHPATVANVGLLRSRGVEFVGPEEGMLSCGYEGTGRLAGVDRVVGRALELLGLGGPGGG